MERSNEPPQPNDVVVAEVVEIGRHTRIELPSKRKATLFVGDLVGVAYGYRYATRQVEGTIPTSSEPCHMLSVAGVCGEVIGTAAHINPPTTLAPVGYLVDRELKRVNLESLGLTPTTVPCGHPTTILVVGSSMDSGKTTTAFSLVHGLMRSGALVCAAKLTGTASAKDLRIMEDAGADLVLDFTDVGHASTSKCTSKQLWHIVTTIESHLAARQLDYIVLEIADGIVQRETAMLLELLDAHHFVDYTIYACADSLGAQAGVERLRQYGLNVVAVSGWVGCSPLAAQEAQAVTDVAIVCSKELTEPSIVDRFPVQRRKAPRPSRAVRHKQNFPFKLSAMGGLKAST